MSQGQDIFFFVFLIRIQKIVNFGLNDIIESLHLNYLIFILIYLKKFTLAYKLDVVLVTELSKYFRKNIIVITKRISFIIFLLFYQL